MKEFLVQNNGGIFKKERSYENYRTTGITGLEMVTLLFFCQECSNLVFLIYLFIFLLPLRKDREEPTEKMTNFILKI